MYLVYSKRSRNPGHQSMIAEPMKILKAIFVGNSERISSEVFHTLFYTLTFLFRIPTDQVKRSLASVAPNFQINICRVYANKLIKFQWKSYAGIHAAFNIIWTPCAKCKRCQTLILKLIDCTVIIHRGLIDVRFGPLKMGCLQIIHSKGTVP